MLRTTPWQELADSLAAEVSPAQRVEWATGTVSDWAQESYDIVTSARFMYCEWEVTGGARTCAPRPGRRVLGESYQQEFAPVVRRRLLQAGVRLADVLSRNLAPG
jgi:hypothetical protein